MVLLNQLETAEVPNSTDVLKAAQAMQAAILTAINERPIRDRRLLLGRYDDYSLTLIDTFRDIADQIANEDAPTDLELFDWQSLENIEHSTLSPHEVTDLKNFLTGCRRDAGIFRGLIYQPLFRMLREFASLLLGLHFGIIHRDLSVVSESMVSLSKLFYALADLIADHQLVLDHDSRNRRRQRMKQTRECKDARHEAIRQKVLKLYQDGKAQGKWKNPHQAKEPITSEIFEEARKSCVLTSRERAEATVYQWICVARKARK